MEAVNPSRLNGLTPEESMSKWRCTVCNYIYDPEVGDPDGGIAPGTPFERPPG